MSFQDCNIFIPAPTSAPVERRAEPRQRVLLTAVLSDSRMDASLSCSLRNISSQGARLQLPGEHLAISWSSLIVVRDACVYRIEPVWTLGDQAGVRFVGSRSLNGPTTPEMQRHRALWLEKLPRNHRTLH